MKAPNSSTFISAVRSSFDFLVALGFLEEVTSATLVTYRRGDVEFCVYHERRSSALGCEFSLAGRRYALSELIRVMDPEAAKIYRDFVARTPAQLSTGLLQLRGLVEKYGVPALAGDAEFASELDRSSKEFVDSYELEVLARNVRPRAERAFQARDFRKAAKLYESIRFALTSVELKKLELAARRAARSDP